MQKWQASLKDNKTNWIFISRAKTENRTSYSIILERNKYEYAEK